MHAMIHSQGILDQLDPSSCASMMVFKLPKSSRTMRMVTVETPEFPAPPATTQEDIRNRFRDQYLANSLLALQ
jgi:hypothetical protein